MGGRLEDEKDPPFFVVVAVVVLYYIYSEAEKCLEAIGPLPFLRDAWMKNKQNLQHISGCHYPGL